MLHNNAHRLRGGDRSAVTITSKDNGKTENLTPCRSETPKNIETKIALNDYVRNPCKLASVVWKSVQRVLLTMLKYNPLVCVPFLFIAYSRNGWTDVHGHGSNDADSPKDCLLRVLMPIRLFRV